MVDISRVDSISLFQCNVSCRGGVELAETYFTSKVLRIYGGAEGHVGLRAESNTRINI